MKAMARVKVTLDLPVSSSWGAGCTVSQVHKQAGEEANEKVRKFFNDQKLLGATITSMEVTAIFVSDAKDEP